MKIITINLSEPHIKALQVLQDIGLYPSRSEAIRVALRDFLKEELDYQGKSPDKEELTREEIAEENKRAVVSLIKRLKQEEQFSAIGA